MGRDPSRFLILETRNEISCTSGRQNVIKSHYFEINIIYCNYSIKFIENYVDEASEIRVEV